MIARRWYDDSLTVALMAVLFDDCSGDLFAMTVQFDDCSDDSFVMPGLILECMQLIKEGKIKGYQDLSRSVFWSRGFKEFKLLQQYDNYKQTPTLTHKESGRICVWL